MRRENPRLSRKILKKNRIFMPNLRAFMTLAQANPYREHGI